MKKSITITIPKPCHEDWAEMTPTQKGKFCAVCTKEVFDFTESSDETLIKKLKDGKDLCGRFHKSQLDRKMTLERKSGTGLLPYAASLLLPLSILSTSEAHTQGGPSINETHFTSLNIGSNPLKSLVTITGFVTNANGIPINNAEVFVLETGYSVRTAPDGSYKLICTSGSTLFSVKDQLRSDTIILGTKDAIIDLKLEEISITKTVRSTTVGKIVSISVPTSCEEPLDGEAPKTVEEETIEGEIEIEKAEEAPQKDIAAMLRGKIGGMVVVNESVQEVANTLNESIQITISGTVRDEEKRPLPFVNIKVKGTSTRTQTDFDGNYTIDIMPNQTLVFSYLGFHSKEILASNISNQIDLDLIMDADIQGEAVIVLGGIRAVDQDNNPFDHETAANKEKQEARIAKRKQAAKNEAAFKKIKIERAKAQRQLKKSNKNNK